MNHESCSPKADSEEITPVEQSQDQQGGRESSSDDVPLRQQHLPRAPIREGSHNLRDRRQLRDHMLYVDDASSLDQRRAAHQATLRKPPKGEAKSSVKVGKKPGPRPWASKPIMKNDMAAKKEVIREIESFWGKGFIKAYIPKCHRPLVKRGKGGKRAIYRDHETDPKKWLPSVLKAILMIAKLTTNKMWLKKAMNDVVRYRIKNTGNRKPQLVTTDFDVLEDMLVKDWDVAYSFGIRYKHLLVNRLGQQETDEDIDHILGVGSGVENGSDDDDVNGDNRDEDEEDIDDSNGDDDEMGDGGLTGRHLHASGYTDASQRPRSYSTPGPPPKYSKVRQEKNSKRNSELPPRPQPPPRYRGDQQGYGQPHPYGPPIDPWGRPMPYGAYGGYGMYGGYNPYSDSDGRQAFQPPGFHSTGQYPPASSQQTTDRAGRSRAPGSPFGGMMRTRGGYELSPSSTSRPPYSHPQDLSIRQPEVKQESPEFEGRSDGRAISVDDAEGAVNDLGEDSNAAALEAELRATELELKVARLQAKRAALNQQSRAK